jgi:thiol-disulfide isomerase/thioredoxin
VAHRSARAVLSAFAAAACLLGAAPPAPLELVTLAGERVSLAPSDGRALVVHFWATWCPSCANELPELVRASAACAAAVEIAIVDVGDGPDDVRAFLVEHGITAAPLLDPDGKAWRAAVGGGGLPANLVWSATERRSELGPRTPERWRELLAQLGCTAAPGAR